MQFGRNHDRSSTPHLAGVFWKDVEGVAGRLPLDLGSLRSLLDGPLGWCVALRAALPGRTKTGLSCEHRWIWEAKPRPSSLFQQMAAGAFGVLVLQSLLGFHLSAEVQDCPLITAEGMQRVCARLFLLVGLQSVGCPASLSGS